MSGYFSRLIQQTGMALTVGEVSAGVNLPNATSITPLEELGELQKVGETIKQFDEDEFKLRQNVENQESSVSTPFQNQDSGNRDYSLPLAVEQDAALPIGEKQDPIIQKKPVERSSENSPLSPEASGGLNVPKPPQPPKAESEKIVENLTNIVQKIQPATDISLPEYPVQSKESDTPSESRRDRQSAAIPKESQSRSTRLVTLQTVREWVAGDLGTQEQRSQGEEERRSGEDKGEFSQSPIPNPQSPIFNPQSPIPNPQSPIPNPHSQKSQDFVLSIGTISLTVEAPQPEIQQSPPPPMRSKQEIKPTNSTSRLNRHYIRLR